MSLFLHNTKTSLHTTLKKNPDNAIEMSHTLLARSPHYSNRHRVSSILTRGQTSILSRTKNRLIHSHPVNTRPNTRGRVTVLEIEATISGQEMSASFGVKSGT